MEINRSTHTPASCRATLEFGRFETRMVLPDPPLENSSVALEDAPAQSRQGRTSLKKPGKEDFQAPS
jgi:hypothetical protein